MTVFVGRPRNVRVKESRMHVKGRMPGRRPGLVLLGLVTAAACGSSSSPAGPSDPGNPPGGSTCRAYATSSTSVSTGQGFNSTVNQACSFNTNTRQATCAAQYSDNFGTSATSTTIVTYPSVAAFVDEVQVVPPLTKSVGTSSTTSGTAGASASSSTHTFDGQGRLMRITGQSAAGTVTTTYTQWDGSGRPTAGSDSGPGVANALVLLYNDVARTRATTATAASGPAVTTVETFDANGNPIQQTTSSQTSTLSTVITVNGTQSVCR